MSIVLTMPPWMWYHTFDQAVLWDTVGFERGQFDNCLYFLRDEQQNLVAIMRAHVDDTIIGGSGPIYEKSRETTSCQISVPEVESRQWRILRSPPCSEPSNLWNQLSAVRVCTTSQTDQHEPRTGPWQRGLYFWKGSRSLASSQWCSKLVSRPNTSRSLRSNLTQSTMFSTAQSERPSVCQPVSPRCQAVQRCYHSCETYPMGKASHMFSFRSRDCQCQRKFNSGRIYPRLCW